MLQQDCGLQLQGQLFVVLIEHDYRQNKVEEFKEENEFYEFFIVCFDADFEVLYFVLYLLVVFDRNVEFDFLVVEVENVGQVDLVSQGHELSIKTQEPPPC